MEGSITRFYPEYPLSTTGAESFITRFSTPAGFASHVNAETPGSIHEGGELGYALAVSWGAVMDKPDLVTVCVVGDGEAETGPTATAWHSHKVRPPLPGFSLSLTSCLVHRPRGIRSMPPDRQYQRLQNRRTDHLRHNGRPRTDHPLCRVRVPTPDR